MARRQDDATILLRMSKAEREQINRALGKGKVNALAVRLLLDFARDLERSHPQLRAEVAA
jgi:hypothetical protein